MTKRLLIALALCVIPLAAQTSQLQGTITDQQGAVVPNTVVTATNLETSSQRQALANDSGAFTFLQMPPGTYKVEAQSSGFRSFVQQIKLQVNTPATLDIKLEVGSVNETVNVTAEAPSINTQNATIGNPFTETQIRQLPLETRNIVALLSLQPGVASDGQVLGAKADQNNVILDGVDVNDSQPGTTTSAFNSVLAVPLDSVQEFRTTVAGQGADQGRSSGGQVALVTKSGSNQYHGSMYEYHRNKVTAANNWFSNRAGIPRENLVRNQYGASVGGRIIRDRAFFFANWEDRKDRTATAVSRTVPTESYRQGIVKFRLNNGSVGELSPAEVQQADPLRIGASSYVLDQMKLYPEGNDPAGSTDRGLNFSLFRFNAPETLDYRTYVAKTDFNLDASGKHTLSIRGTLMDNQEIPTAGLEQFPGQGPQSLELNASKGLSTRYTTVLSPSVVNNFNYGYTRLKTESTGGGGYAVGSTLSNLNAFPRASVRVAPTHNFVDDVTWNKGRHTVQTGANIRLVVNDRTNFNNYPTYSFGRNTLDGLGNDITQPVLDLARAKYGNSGLTLTDANQLTNAMGTLLSLVNSYSLNFQFNREGQAIPVGEGIVRSYGTNEYEFYLQDTFKWRRDVTLTYGVRYGLYTVPYEKNGVQVSPTTGLDQFFADRVGGQAAGIPSNALPTAKLTYNLAGRANDAAGWYQTDKNNFAPRVSIAYAPEEGSFAARFLGKGSVIRAGAGTVYDRYGSSMIVSFATSGSPGLSTNVAQPVNTNFTTSFRYSGSELPKLQVPNGGMPFSPGTIVGGFNAFTGVSPDLKAPYSFVLDASYARPLPGGITVEVGYLGRLARKGLLRQDFAQALTQFKDPKSGQTWAQASGVLRDAFESGITPAQVRANPSLLPEVPFMENIFGKAANRTFTGSATANYFYSVYQTYAGSDLDALSAMDRTRLSDGTCISAYGCNTFFALQSAGLQTWVNAGYMNYHGGILTVRRAVQGGWGFDFNYTLSHAIDIASASEAASGGGALIQDSFNPSASRASANFDIRHNMNMNGIFELPFGKSKPFLNNAPGWVEQFVGGWQVSLLGRFRSGLPENITKGGVYQTNYLSSSLAILRPGASLPDSGVTYNQNGEPSIFANTSAANSFIGQYPGTVGSRNIVRGASLLNFDLSAAKSFTMPYHEGHRIQLRGEAFNAFNNVNFRNLSLSLATPTTFGRFSEAEDARVMQFALRYEF